MKGGDDDRDEEDGGIRLAISADESVKHTFSEWLHSVNNVIGVEEMNTFMEFFTNEHQAIHREKIASQLVTVAAQTRPDTMMTEVSNDANAFGTSNAQTVAKIFIEMMGLYTLNEWLVSPTCTDLLRYWVLTAISKLPMHSQSVLRKAGIYDTIMKLADSAATQAAGGGSGATSRWSPVAIDLKRQVEGLPEKQLLPGSRLAMEESGGGSGSDDDRTPSLEPSAFTSASSSSSSSTSPSFNSAAAATTTTTTATAAFAPAISTSTTEGPIGRKRSREEMEEGMVGEVRADAAYKPLPGGIFVMPGGPKAVKRKKKSLQWAGPREMVNIRFFSKAEESYKANPLDGLTKPPMVPGYVENENDLDSDAVKTVSVGVRNLGAFYGWVTPARLFIPIGSIGENSEERVLQRERELHFPAETYFSDQAIPPNPREAEKEEMDDSVLVPEIPLIRRPDVHPQFANVAPSSMSLASIVGGASASGMPNLASFLSNITSLPVTSAPPLAPTSSATANANASILSSTSLSAMLSKVSAFLPTATATVAPSSTPFSLSSSSSAASHIPSSLSALFAPSPFSEPETPFSSLSSSTAASAWPPNSLLGKLFAPSPFSQQQQPQSNLAASFSSSSMYGGSGSSMGLPMALTTGFMPLPQPPIPMLGTIPPTHANFKTKPCSWHNSKGGCRRGEACTFIHN